MHNIISFPQKVHQEKAMEELLKEIRQRHVQPEDALEITALLEAMGWTDEQSRQTFGVNDVFELAELAWEKIQKDIIITPFTPIERPSLWRLTQELMHQFLRGVIFALPMAVSVIAMLTLKFSLWSYENSTVQNATSIGIGTILSFMVVGGFTQAIARRGFFYVMLGYYNMARRLTFYFIRIGFVVCIIVSILLYLINMIFHILPYRMITISVLYFFFLNMIWLSVTVFYVLRKEVVFTGLITLGIFIIWLLFDFFHILPILTSQLIALAIVSVIGFFLVRYYFHEAERKMDKGIAPQMPRSSFTIYSIWPYFVYGFLYFSFLFMDRIIAWSTPDQFLPYVLWFRNPYELGLDFALLVLIIPMGISEVIVTKIMKELEESQKGYLAVEVHQLKKRFTSIYTRRLLIMIFLTSLNALLFYGLLIWFFTNHPDSIGIWLFTNPITHFVFICGIIGYVFLAIGLMNAVILLSLSQAKMVKEALLPAFLINLLVGFVSSRWAYHIIGPNLSNNPGHSYAVFGLVIGAFLFAVLSIRKVYQLHHKLDYYMNAAT